MVDSGKVDHRTQQPIMKPDVVVDYTKNMRLVDKTDMMIASVECIRKSVKWYKKLYYHMLDVAMLNAYNMYVVHKNVKTSLRIFSKQVIQGLLDKHGHLVSTVPGHHTPDSYGPGRLDASQWVTHHHLADTPPTPKRAKAQKQCEVCAKTRRRPQQRKVVTSWCPACRVGLCLACFVVFHSTKNF